jgi:sugar/nucleoside kinase (ribokinase family)
MPAIRAHCVFFLAASRAAHLVLKMGAGGVLLASAAEHASRTLGAYTVPLPRPPQTTTTTTTTTTSVRFRAFASKPIPHLVNTSGAFFSSATCFAHVILVSSSLSAPRSACASPGAGDSLVGAFVAALCHGLDVDAAVECGIRAARLTLAHSASISPLIDAAAVGIVRSP